LTTPTGGRIVIAVTLAREENVVLIGMPGVGKSTAGVLLAKALSREFVDTDVTLQARLGRRLADIIAEQGMDAFCRQEEAAILALDVRPAVIATGGSAVYSPAAMAHLRQGGRIVHLDLPLEVLRRRLGDLGERGVVIRPGQTLEALFAERQPLYRRYADLAIACLGLSHDEVVARIVDAL